MENRKKYAPLTDREEQIAKTIVDSAFSVHRALGPGLYESVYEACFRHELTKRQCNHAHQVIVPVIYDGIILDEGFRLDVLVENLVICELKSVDAVLPVHKAQVLTYLKLTQKRLGFLINFNVPVIKYGIYRIIL